MNKNTILTDALNQRHEEILGYDINITNYTLAIAKINQEYNGTTILDQALQEFRAQLENLLQSSIIERTKASIIRDVLHSQIEE